MDDRNEFSFLNSLDDIFFAFDASGTPIAWNQAAEEVTGYTEDKLETMSPADFFDAEDSDRIHAAVQDVFEAGRARVEADLVTADGERIPYEFKVRKLSESDPPAFAGIGRDITERHRQRQELASRQQTLREMYEIIADRQRTFSEQVEALLSLGRNELDTDYGTLSHISGEDYIFEFVDADDDRIQPGDVVPLSATNCEIAASREETLVLGDVARDAPDQTDRAGYAEWGIACYIGAPVFVEDDVYGTFCFYDTEPRVGQFSEWEVTLVDLMSRWVSYELQRKQTSEELRQQNERLERFASVVSHDIRNPLNVIEGSLQLAEETGELEHISRGRRAVKRMNTLIDDLLTLARSGDVIGELEKVDLSELSTQCWDSIATSDATLEVESGRRILADRTRLQQLLENLFRNAVEHGGDAVTVRVGGLDDGFYVEDTGEGIPEKERERVFEGGYSTTNEGTGFGLSIVSEIADAHGWDVELTASPEGGARFEFTGTSGESG